MATSIETRHTEKDALFKLLQVKLTGDIDAAIAQTRAKMEKEDIDAVINEFELWQKTINK